MKNGLNRKLRYGSVSLGLTALVICGVLLINLLVSIIATANHSFLDLTTEPIYTLSETGVNLLDQTLKSANEGREEDDPVVVDIIFCADPDILNASDLMRYIYYTALEMQEQFPQHIRVRTEDVWDNPSSVDAYRTNSYSKIYQSDVIVASGSEFRVYSYKSFYALDSATASEPWAFSGEKKFLSGIIAVTRAEAPICAFTYNHGETIATEKNGEIVVSDEYTEFVKVIENSGYDTMFIDLQEEEIPKNCRLIVTFDPQEDFVSSFLTGGTSEISKLEAYLENAYSFLIVADADTPELPVLEEYLEEWGVAFKRHIAKDESGSTVKGTYQVVDLQNSLDTEGLSLIGQYESAGMGASLTQDLRNVGGSPKVVFPNALAIAYSPTYQTVYQIEDTELNIKPFTYANYTKNKNAREIFDIFRSGETSYAHAKQDGERLTDDKGADLIVDTTGAFKLMTITRESRIVSEGQGYTSVNESSFVCAIGSTEFASNAVLSSNAYGNTDVLQSVLRTIGREVVPVGLDYKPLYSPEVGTEYYNKTQAYTYLVVLAALPAVGFVISGVYVLVRRKIRN